MMFRLFVSASLLFFATVAGAFAQSALPTHRAQVTVGADVVRLGDLVTGTGALANTAVFRSPAPGTSGSLSAQDVALAAYRAGIELVDFAGVQQVSIRRLDNAMRRAAIANLLTFKMADVTGEALSNLRIESGDLPLSVRHDAGDASRPPQIVDFIFDEDRSRVSATLLTRAEDRMIGTRIVAAAVIEAEAIVLSSGVTSGDLIKRADLTIRRMPRRSATGAVNDPERIVGQQARRAMVAGSILRTSDLQAPTLVLRNREVLIQLKRGGLALTARGRAMEDGALGDMVDVMNIRSQKVLQGTVQRDGSVLVGGTGRPMTVRQAAGRRALMDALGTPDSPLNRTNGRSNAPLTFEGLRS